MAQEDCLMKVLRVLISVVLLTLEGTWLNVLPVQAQEEFDCSTVTDVPEAECEALVAIYNTTDGVSWFDNAGWLQMTTVCDWYGVTCEAGHVTYLDLQWNRVIGALPSEIGNLTALTYLDLYHNNLTALPPEIGALKSLTELNLGENALTMLPPEIGNLTELMYLRLRLNALSTLPPEIGNLTALAHLELSNNDLSTLPSEISKLTALTHLYLWGNDLTELPPEIGSLSTLQVFSPAGNDLTTLPAEIGALSALNQLDLSNNDLVSLPPQIGNLAALTHLDLSSNALTALPAEIGNLKALTQFDLRSNALTALPEQIGGLTALTYLNLSNNDLATLPPETGNLVALTQLELGSNNLTTLPNEIGNLAALTQLDLFYNALTALPAGIGNLTQLTHLQAFNNALSTLPPEIGGLTALTHLDLANNQLMTLPVGIGDLSALNRFDLSHNALVSLPSQIGNLTALTQLDLSHNTLIGLPDGIGNLTGLTELGLVHNALTALPVEIGNLTGLSMLDVTDNALTALPSEIGHLKELSVLNLSHNVLGSLPSEIGNLTKLRELDARYNALVALPSDIGNLTNLNSLYLNHNILENLPPEIGNLTKLRSLALDDNALSSLPSEIGRLTALWYLFLSHNALRALPEEIGDLSGLSTLHLHDNPLSGEMPRFLTPLTLYQFTFYDTQWCMPETGPVHDWLAYVWELADTGLICGQPPGSLQGTVTQSDGDLVPGIYVSLYRWGIQEGNWTRVYVTMTHTTEDGSYRVNGLGQRIGYWVKFVDPSGHYAPEYYNDRVALEQATPVRVTLGETLAGIDAVLRSPSPPIVSIETESGSVSSNPQDGTVTLNLSPSSRSDITVTRVVTCAMGTPLSVTLKLTAIDASHPMTLVAYPMTLAGINQYQAVVSGTDITKDADIAVSVHCETTTTETIVGHVNLYDPSGSIVNAITGQPVEGATVMLYHVPRWRPKVGPNDNRLNTCESNRSKIPDAPWSQKAPTDLGVIVNPETKLVDPPLYYQTTDNVGYYGWDVSEGCWYVVVEAKSYISLTSPVVGVPPEVTDLDLALKPVAQITKTVTPVYDVHNNDVLTYSIRFKSPGLASSLWDPMPAGITYIEGSITSTLSPPAVYSSTSHAIVWDGTLPTKTVGTVQFQATLGITGEDSMHLAPLIINTAWLTVTEMGYGLSASAIVNPLAIYLPLVLR